MFLSNLVQWVLGYHELGQMLVAIHDDGHLKVGSPQAQASNCVSLTVRQDRMAAEPDVAVRSTLPSFG